MNYRIVIDGQIINRLFTWQDAKIWRQLLRETFKKSRIDII